MFEKAIKIIMSEPTELHYPSYYADLLSEADVPDKDVGELNKFIDGLEEIFADLRERHGDDSVCGLCEYDGAYIGQSGDWCNECPGFEKEDCFKLSDECKKRWIDTITNSLPSARPEISILTVTVAPDPKEIERVVRKIKDAPVMLLPSAEPEKRTDKRTETHSCDLIDRQSAIDIANDLRDCISVDGYWALMERLKKLPSAQPEVIRCKDCKHQVKEWREDKRLKENGYWVYGCKVISEICGYWAWFGQDDEFCSEAERRTDE